MSTRTVAAGDIVEQILATRMVAVMRGFGPEQALKASRALIRGGVRVIEISLVDPQALSSIGLLREELDDSYPVGAGTVLTKSEAETALAAGADFLFCPGLNPDVIAVAEVQGALAIPGVLTPSEVTSALVLGARLMKLFPAEPLGPGYLKQLMGPFPDVRMVPTGGISAANASAYLDAGAVALGTGSSVANPAWARENRYEFFERAAEEFVQSLNDTERGQR